MSNTRANQHDATTTDYAIPFLAKEMISTEQRLKDTFEIQGAGLQPYAIQLISAITDRLASIDFLDDLSTEMEENYQALVRDFAWAISNQVVEGKRDIEEVLSFEQCVLSPWDGLFCGSNRLAGDVINEVKRLLKI